MSVIVPASWRATAPDYSSAARWFVALQERSHHVAAASVGRWKRRSRQPLRVRRTVHLWRRLDEASSPLSPSPAELAAMTTTAPCQWRNGARGRRAREIARRRLQACCRLQSGRRRLRCPGAGRDDLCRHIWRRCARSPMVVYETCGRSIAGSCSRTARGASGRAIRADGEHHTLRTHGRARPRRGLVPGREGCRSTVSRDGRSAARYRRRHGVQRAPARRRSAGEGSVIVTVTEGRWRSCRCAA